MKNAIVVTISIVFIIILSIIICQSMLITRADNNACVETNVHESTDNTSIIPAIKSDSASINDTSFDLAGVTSTDPTAAPMVTTVPECHPVTIQSSSLPTPAPQRKSLPPPTIPTRPGEKNPLPTVKG
ncbi:hypothetical protein [Methanocella sp.]|uniref:hypothetical protein n=1 Tax=Methanocella sp. TaxID=2052833 RepID=UPI002D8108E1|nr:hypothetical protein [Methanocella sp.]